MALDVIASRHFVGSISDRDGYSAYRTEGRQAKSRQLTNCSGPDSQLLTRSPEMCRLTLHMPAEVRLLGDWGSGTLGLDASAGARTAPAAGLRLPRSAAPPLPTP